MDTIKLTKLESKIESSVSSTELSRINAIVEQGMKKYDMYHDRLPNKKQKDPNYKRAYEYANSYDGQDYASVDWTGSKKRGGLHA